MSAENTSAGGLPAANSSNSSQVLELAPEFVWVFMKEQPKLDIKLFSILLAIRPHELAAPGSDRVLNRIEPATLSLLEPA